MNDALSQFNFVQESPRFPSTLPGESLAKTHHKQALICSRKTSNLATPATTESRCRIRHQNAKHGGSSTTSVSASNINMASLYDYLKQFYEKVSDDPGGKNLTFLCELRLPGFKKQLHTSTAANLKWHIELKHPASLSRYVWMNKNQKTWLHVITVQDTVMELYRCVAEIRMKVKFKDRCGPRKGARGAGRKFGPLLNATGPTPLKWQIIVTL